MKVSGKIREKTQFDKGYVIFLENDDRKYSGYSKAPEWAAVGMECTIDYEEKIKGDRTFFNIKTIVGGVFPKQLITESMMPINDEMPVLVLRFKGKEYSVELR